MGQLLRKLLSEFHVLNSAVWIAYGLVSFAGALPYVGLVPHLNSVQSVAVNRATFALAGLLSTSLLRSFFQHKRLASLPEIAAWVFAISYMCGLAATALANWERQAAGGQVVGGWASLFGGAISAFAVYVGWCACYFVVQSYRDVQSEKQNALRAEATAHEARLTALRGQLNPHFLFNSLNSIQALIAENPARAQTAVGELASLLRHFLGQKGSALVPLREGLEIVMKYLAIEEIRFEENLIVRADVDPDAEDWLVPRLLLHPLVENAVRYGMQTSSMPLRVGIRASASDGGMCLEVANTGCWLDEDREGYFREGNGIGLRLVREQLEQSYPDNFHFVCLKDDDWVVQRIEILSQARAEKDALSCVAGG
jgi:two-component system, LytTR family, sensor kinase